MCTESHSVAILARRLLAPRRSMELPGLDLFKLGCRLWQLDLQNFSTLVSVVVKESKLGF